MSVYLCVTFVVFTDCESCTRPISTKPGVYGTEVGEYGLTRGMCFVARRLEVVAVAGLNFVVCFGWGGFLRVLFSFRTYMACCKYMRPCCLIYFLQVPECVQGWLRYLISLLACLYCSCVTFVVLMRHARGKEATEAVFGLHAKKPLQNEAVFCLQAKNGLILKRLFCM